VSLFKGSVHWCYIVYVWLVLLSTSESYILKLLLLLAVALCTPMCHCLSMRELRAHGHYVICRSQRSGLAKQQFVASLLTNQFAHMHSADNAQSKHTINKHM
jgi:hypothetical protein